MSSSKLSDQQERDRRILLRIVSEAPTPHNNYFFSCLAANAQDIAVELHYVYDAKNVPGRPWKSLAEDVGAMRVRTGINKRIDFYLIWKALMGSGVFFVIGWNYPALYLLICALGLRRGRLIMWFDTPQDSRGLRWFRLKGLLKIILIKMINRSRGTVFGTGKRAKEAMLKMGFRPDKLALLPFFVPQEDGKENDEYRHCLSEDRRRREHTVVFLAAGRFIKSKGFDIFLEALAIVDAKIPSGWQALLVGSGPESESLKARCSSLKLGDQMEFISWLEPKDFQRCMQLCDVFVAPARFDPFPTTVISAMQMGKVVVATAGVGSAVEFIQNGHNGLIVPIADPSSLADCLLSLLNNWEFVRRMGGNAKSTMCQWPVARGVEILRSAVKSINS